MEKTTTFFRDNFHVLLMAALFVFTYLFWYYSPNPDLTPHLKDINQGVFYGLLALIGIRPRATTPPVNIDTLTTEGGDINARPNSNAPAESGKEIKRNEETPVGP